MSRMHEVEVRLSLLPQNHKNIVYLVTEERRILEDVFVHASSTLKGIAGKNLRECKTDRTRFFNYMTTNGFLVDAYEVFQLGTDLIHMKKEESCFPGMDPLERAVFFELMDFHIIKENQAAHFLKQFLTYAKAQKENGRQVVLFLISPILKLPIGFDEDIEIIDVPEWNESDIRHLLLEEAIREKTQKEISEIKQRYGELVETLDETDRLRIERAVKDLKGISSRQIAEVIIDLQSEFGSFYGQSKAANGRTENLKAIEAARRNKVFEVKKEAASHDSTITMLESEDAVAGLLTYNNWLKEIKDDLLNPQEALRWGNLPPKGVLLTGVPGSGKTQAAKMTAERMGKIPLVQFRMDNLLGSLMGDSEANFRRCRKRIEALAPCVVLMDELEKTFDTESGAGNNDVKMNILTALLDWMQENKKPVFFFATSNSVSKLKPELLRDGRFDMRFCVFMPTFRELIEIFEFHMEQSNRRSGYRLYHNFDYTQIAENFLEAITEYAAALENQDPNHPHKIHMFYTGANIENLIAQTNRKMRSRGYTDFRQKDFEEALLEVAKSESSQPYGMTNMKDIAQFWLDARLNQYANAGGFNLFPFSSFDEVTSEFVKKPQTDNQYDTYMFECISAKITELHKERKND